MMLEEMLKDEREAGRKEGLKIGRPGRQKSVSGVSQCVGKPGRYEDLKRCLEDEAFMEGLLEEFGIK